MSDEATRKTVGQISTTLQAKAHDDTHSATDQMREQLKDYEQHVFSTLRSGKSDYNGTFYVVVLTKKERLMPNVLRNYFFTRSTCPTPEYDQAVYQYSRSDDKLDFLWVVPSKHTCEMYKERAVTIPTEEKELLHYVLDFEDGTLFKKALVLNKELE